MISREDLFLGTLDDLERKMRSADRYELLLLASLLRKLFFEGSNLVDQVNRPYRLKIMFESGLPTDAPQVPPGLMFWTTGDGLDPDTSPFPNRFQSNGQKFFQTVVAVLEGHQYSVKDIVLFEAHVVGAVHPGAPKDDKQKALEAFDKTAVIGGLGSGLFQLRSVARVVLKALTPLRQAVLAARKRERLDEAL